ncbi:MAG TPA: FtsX-like permease family protein [Solirubrobacteraceae bacterium]|nr:FtsX-like permease family protein [Solirubrobacteraceae bacterium]
MKRKLNPRIAGVRVSMLVHLYRVRLRSHAVQELLAGSGIAVGVALVLGVLVANTSLTGSAGELVHQVVGSSRLQLSARSQQGFEQRLAEDAGQLPGVKVAAPLLRENITLLGPHGRSAVQLLGITPAALQLGTLGAHGARSLVSSGAGFSGGLLIPTSVAATSGLEPGDRVTVLAFGAAHTVKIGGVLGNSAFGALASSPVVLTVLSDAQRLTGLTQRVTQAYVEPLPGRDRLVSSELHRLAGQSLEVAPSDHELSLLEGAAHPNNQSTELFAAISVMVGFLLALNAMLLTVPERRRFVADLRMQGYDWRQIIVLLAFQAIVLGLAASAVGVALGDLLSHAFLHRIPAYLITAFPIGSQEILRPGTIAIALACGVLATVLASLSPALDLRPSRPTDAALRDREGGSEVIGPTTTMKATLAGLVSVVLITVLVLLEPGLTIVGGVLLALATLSAIPGLFALLARGLRWSGERVRSSALIIVVSELRATTTRVVALAGIAALAVYGSVAIGGTRDDLLRGLDANFGEYLQTADVWVTTGGNDLTTNSFAAGGLLPRLRALPQVSSARSYQGGFLDVGDRRMWLIARPPGDYPLIASSQLLHGAQGPAERLLRKGGWATVSGGFASEHGLGVGAHFTLPTPTGPLRLGVAAITSNLGWAPGAIVLNSADYRTRWATGDPTAFEIRLAPGVTPSAGSAAISHALGNRPGLGVQTFAERRHQYMVDSRQGLQALSEIATMLLIAAALAVASALSAAIWQRRARLASLKIQGYATAQLWRALLLESALVLGVGCAVGAVFGVYGHALASRWLRLNTGFPAQFTVGLPGVFLTLALLAIIALAVISLPGLAAARAPARTTFQE